jgi:hypothetical protein
MIAVFVLLEESGIKRPAEIQAVEDLEARARTWAALASDVPLDEFLAAAIVYARGASPFWPALGDLLGLIPGRGTPGEREAVAAWERVQMATRYAGPWVLASGTWAELAAELEPDALAALEAVGPPNLFTVEATPAGLAFGAGDQIVTRELVAGEALEVLEDRFASAYRDHVARRWFRRTSRRLGVALDHALAAPSESARISTGR